MASYPSLYTKFKDENVCPICLMEMEFSTRFSCANEHVICYRCKPFYYSCPICHSPLSTEVPPLRTRPPHEHQPSTNPYHMPQPIPDYNPSAPPHFHEHQTHQHPWGPSTPADNQELLPCRYSNSGCRVKVPEYLRNLHETR